MGEMPKKVKRSKGQTIGSKGPNEVKISKFLGLDQKRSKNNNPGLAEAEIVVAMYKQIGLSSQSPCLDGETGETLPTFVAICQGDCLFVL